MKKKKGVLFVLLPVLITLPLFVVFYSRIQCKPSHAGFWFILALGMSIGVALTRFTQIFKTDKTDIK
jgi:membrane protein CcdC involved in cytochrome C biogenesis